MSLPHAAAAAVRRVPPAYRVLRSAYCAVGDRLPPQDVPGLGPVHRNDLMLDRGSAGAVEHYLAVGEQAADFLDEFVPLATADGVLDFGCGHGRVARVLAQRVPAGLLSVCDLDPTAVRFCSQTFGATPVRGDLDPARLVLGRYDAIWMGSVLTHIPFDAARPLVGRLASRLRPGGVLAFTTHGGRAEREATQLAANAGMTIHGVTEDLDRHGWVYHHYPHSGTGYGLAWQRRAGVERLVSELEVPLEEVAHRPDAWSGWQDLWVFRGPG